MYPIAPLVFYAVKIAFLLVIIVRLNRQLSAYSSNSSSVIIFYETCLLVGINKWKVNSRKCRISDLALREVAWLSFILLSSSTTSIIFILLPGLTGNSLFNSSFRRSFFMFYISFVTSSWPLLLLSYKFIPSITWRKRTPSCQTSEALETVSPKSNSGELVIEFCLIIDGLNHLSTWCSRGRPKTTLFWDFL